MGGVADHVPASASTGDGGVEADDVSDDILVARAFLSRIAEPACIPLWHLVRTVGPIDAMHQILTGTAASEVLRATAARLPTTDPYADLDTAHRYGIRLVVPESVQWPHFAMAALERTGEIRYQEYRRGKTAHAEHGEDVPPLALWVRGSADLPTLGVRSVGIVGARAATAYGEQVAADLAYGLARRGYVIVSGGAYGIDAAAHRGALSAGGTTVIVSAGGVDRPYPASNRRLFELAAESGLLVSESPPGAEPRRRRFLTRNRLIAALSTGCVIAEASMRSGAVNTAGHCLKLDRHLMVVPGPVTSAMSTGCHDLLRRHPGLAHMVTSVEEIVELVGTLTEMSEPTRAASAGPATERDRLRERLDALTEHSRILFDSFGARRTSAIEELVAASGLSVVETLGALVELEAAGLVERRTEGFRIARPQSSDGR